MGGFFSLSQIINYGISRKGVKKPACWNEPVAICLFVTDRCTLSCKWCLRQIDKDFISKTRSDMSLDTAKRILQYFPKATHLSLAGFGEPLLVENLFKIIREVKKRPMRTSIITNGTLLFDRLDEVLNADLHRISISINSLNSADYQLTCGGNKNTFNNLIKGIQLLSEKRKSAKPYLHLSFVLTRNLFNRTQEIIKFAEEISVDFLDLHNLISNDNSNNYTEILTNDDEEVVATLNEWRKKDYKVKVGWPRLVQKGLKNPVRICSPLWDWLGIDTEGNTAGCFKAMPTKKEYGNLFRNGKAVWNNEFRQKLRTCFVTKNKFLFECCKTCTEVQP